MAKVSLSVVEHAVCTAITAAWIIETRCHGKASVSVSALEYVIQHAVKDYGWDVVQVKYGVSCDRVFVSLLCNDCSDYLTVVWRNFLNDGGHYGHSLHL